MNALLSACRASVSLVDHLVGPPAGRRIVAPGRIVVTLHRVQGDAAGAADIQRAAGIDGDVAGADPAQAWRVQLQRATGDAINPFRWRRGAMAQVHARAAGQDQGAAAGTQLDHRPVRAVDDLPVAVAPQQASMRIQQRVATQAQAAAAGQADLANLRAAGVHRSAHAELAIVEGHLDAMRLQAVADLQVALLELEAPRAEDLALVQALVQGGELLAQAAAIAQALGADLQLATEERHAGAAGIAARRHPVCAGPPPRRPRPTPRRSGTAAVVARRQVDQRTGGLAADVAGATAQQQVATPAVFIHIAEAGLASGQVDARAIAQLQVVFGAQAQLAAGSETALSRRISRALRDNSAPPGGAAVEGHRGSARRRRQAEATAAADPTQRTASPVSNGVLRRRSPPL